MVIAAVVALSILATKTTVMRRKLVARKLLYIGTTLLIVWLATAIILSVTDEHLSLLDSIYWSLAMGMSAEPLRNPPSNTLTHFVLLFDSGVSIVMLALIMTAIVEYYLHRLIEYSKGLHTEVKNISDHIVIVGFSKASEKAYIELQAELKDKKFTIVDVPEKSEYIRKIIRPGVDKFVGGIPYEEESLRRTSLWTASAIIISLDDDSKSILALLRIKKLIQEYKKEANRRILIVVEALKDENSKLIKAAYGNDEQDVIIKVVVSRSLVGRLVASALIEPSVLVFLEDATSIVHGITAFTVKKVSEIIHIDEKTTFKDIIRELLNKTNIMERAIPLAIIRNSKGTHDLIINPKLDHDVQPEDYVILLSYEISQKELSRNKENIHMGLHEEEIKYNDYGYYIDKYSWIREGSIEKLWNIDKLKGHITIIGYTEAVESLIDELTNVRRTLAFAVNGRIAPGEKIDKTLILLTEKTPQKHLENTVIVTGKLLSEESLRKSGVLTADVIMVSTGIDHTTTHILLHVRDLISSSCPSHRDYTSKEGPYIEFERIINISEVDTSDIADILINNRLSDVAIPSRTFGGVLLAYAVINPEVFSFIEDVTSATEGEGDLREIRVTKHLIGGKKEIAFGKLVYKLKKETNMLPLALVTKIKGKNVIIYIPDPRRRVKINDRLVVLAPSRK